MSSTNRPLLGGAHGLVGWGSQALSQGDKIISCGFELLNGIWENIVTKEMLVN